MQIKLSVSISEYIKKVLNGNYFFPDFSDKCPICGAKNCAVRIGYYYRYAFIFELKTIVLIPIARYLCRRKNSASSKLSCSHKTFSLLPSSLIPYSLLDSDSLLFLAKLRFVDNFSLLAISAEFASLSENPTPSLNSNTLSEYISIFIIATKIIITLFKINFDTWDKWVKYFLNYPGSLIALIEKVYSNHAKFLFGRPSHIRFP